MQDLWAKVSSLSPTVPLIAFANHVIQDQTAQYLCLEQGYDVIGYLITCLYQMSETSTRLCATGLFH